MRAVVLPRGMLLPLCRRAMARRQLPPIGQAIVPGRALGWIRFRSRSPRKDRAEGGVAVDLDPRSSIVGPLTSSGHSARRNNHMWLLFQ